MAVLFICQVNPLYGYIYVLNTNIYSPLFFPKIKRQCSPLITAEVLVNHRKEMDMQTQLGDVWILGMPFFRGLVKRPEMWPGSNVQNQA